VTSFHSSILHNPLPIYYTGNIIFNANVDLKIVLALSLKIAKYCQDQRDMDDFASGEKDSEHRRAG
jgi:hypothetical protein